MQGSLPPEAQEKLEELQDLQETAQQVATQKQQTESRLNEVEAALNALEDIDADTTMYREIGELLVETEYDEANDDLADTKESLEVRVETLDKQENRVRQEFEKLQTELQEMLGGAGGGMGGGPSPGGPGGPGPGGPSAGGD